MFDPPFALLFAGNHLFPNPLLAGHHVGASGFGTMAISILTAPWSVLLASVARLLAPSLAPAVMRGAGLALIVLATLLNARILYGMAARAERDARAAQAARGAKRD